MKFWLYPALLFFLVFGWFASSVSDFRFFDDDYGAAFCASQCNSVGDFLSFFSSNHNDKTIMPSNYLESFEAKADSTTYRPLTLCWYKFVSLFLDVNQPFNFFLLGVFLHALLCLLMFFIFSRFISPWYSFWSALLFGLFPFCGNFIGRFVIQPYSLGLILISLAYLCFSNLKMRILSLTLMFFAMLMHEAFLSSVFLFLFLIVCDEYNLFYSDKKLFLRNVFKASAPFVMVILFYFIIKLIVYGVSFEQQSFLSVFLHKLRYRFYDFVTLVLDVLGYSFLPNKVAFLKIGLILFDAAIFICLAIFAGCSWFFWSLCGLFAVNLWPSILVMHVSRYLYFSIPFLLLAVFWVYEHRLVSSKCPFAVFLRIALITKLTALLIFGAFQIRADLTFLQNKFVFVDNAIKTFASSEHVALGKCEKLMFIGLPFDYFPVSGFAQAIWLYSKNNNLKIYYDPLHTVHFDSLNSLPQDNFSIVEHSFENRIKFKITSGSVLLQNPFGFKTNYSLGRCDALSNSELNFLVDYKFVPYCLFGWDNVAKKIIPL